MSRGTLSHVCAELSPGPIREQSTMRQAMRGPYYALIKRCLGGLSREQATVLLYHSVSDVFSPMSVRIAEFERQMAYLAERFEIVPLDVLRGWLTGVEPPRSNRPMAALTFDDGYLDNYENVRPILLRRQLPATFYVTVGLVEGQSPAAWGPPLRMMSWDQVRKMAEDGFEIGAHTVTHPDLSQLPDADVRRELVEGRALLEAQLQRPVRSFAYPGGHYDARVKRLVAEAGYEIALTTRQGVIAQGDDRLEVKRIGVGHFVGFTFFQALLSRAVQMPSLMWL